MHTRYTLESKFFSFPHRTFVFKDPSGQPVLFAKMKAFRLKEDVRIYSDPEHQNEVLSIQARKIMDFSACFDVFDSATGQKVGVLKREGIHSMIKDKWIITGPDDRTRGSIDEDDALLALFRRYLVNLIPQSFKLTVDGNPAGEFKQNFNPFLLKMQLDFSVDTGALLDRRLGLAAALLLCAVEGRQS